MNDELYLAVSHIYGSGFHCVIMVKIQNVNNSDLKDTGIESLIVKPSAQGELL